MRVLIGYSSAHGSTAEIAQRIADVLQGGSLTAEVCRLEDVHSLAGFDAVVLGSAIHNQAWLPDAVEFVERNVAALGARSVWLFSVGMSDGLPRILRSQAKAAQNRRLAKALRAQTLPRGHGLFSGVAPAEAFPRWVGFGLRAIGGHFGDLRDWDEIENWARGIRREVTARGGQQEGTSA
jgi:menaquinone-dependent protoporphyrinogen oxidase